jgi:hypothetical protein
MARAVAVFMRLPWTEGAAGIGLFMLIVLPLPKN